MQPKLIDIDCDGMTLIGSIPEQSAYVFGTEKGELVILRYCVIATAKDQQQPIKASGAGVLIPRLTENGLKTEEVLPECFKVHNEDTGDITIFRLGFAPKCKRWVLWGIEQMHDMVDRQGRDTF